MKNSDSLQSAKNVVIWAYLPYVLTYTGYYISQIFKEKKYKNDLLNYKEKYNKYKKYEKQYN